MPEKIDITVARDMAANILRPKLVPYGVSDEEDIIEESAFEGGRFWVFFWNRNIRVSVLDRNLADGWACAINDAGNLRLFYDFREDAVKQREILSGLKLWAAMSKKG